MNAVLCLSLSTSSIMSYYFSTSNGLKQRFLARVDTTLSDLSIAYASLIVIPFSGLKYTQNFHLLFCHTITLGDAVVDVEGLIMSQASSWSIVSAITCFVAGPAFLIGCGVV